MNNMESLLLALFGIIFWVIVILYLQSDYE